MFQFFYATRDKWGDDALKLTGTGIVTVALVILALIAVSLIVRRLQTKTKSRKLTTKQLVFSAAAMALGMVTSLIKLFDLPMGGSVTLLSMLFVVLIAYWYGPYIGIMTGVAYGLLQFIIEPFFYTIPQMLVDYPLAFGALGLAGFCYKRKHGLILGYVIGVLGRYFFAFLSGMIFFGVYAAEYNMNTAVYSLVYNGSYLISEAVITLIIIALPPVSKALLHVKQLAVTE